MRGTKNSATSENGREVERAENPLDIKALRAILPNTQSPMKRPILSCLAIAAMLVACDKQRGGDAANSNDPNKPGATRATRAARQDLPGRQKELRDALAEAKKIKIPEDRDKALVECAKEALEINPNAVAEIIRLLSADHPERVLLLKAMIARLMVEDPSAATQWAATLESEKERALAGGEIALHTAATDPARAAELLAASGISGREFDEVAVQVLQNWATETPADAAAWVLRFPQGASRETAVKTVVSRWVQGDAEAAFSWIGTLKSPAVRKETTRSLAFALIDNPDPVRDAMLEHADPAMRSDLEQQIGQIKEETRDKSEPEPEPEPEPAPAPAPEVVPAPVPEVAPEPEVVPEPAMEPEEEMEEEPADPEETTGK